MGDGHGRVGGEQQLPHRLAEQVGAADDHGVQARQVFTMDPAYENHRTSRRAGYEPAFEIACRQLAGIDDMQTIDVLFRQDRLDDRFGIQVFRQRQLNEDAVQRGVGVERLHQGSQLFLRRLLGQRVLDGGEATFLGHLALRGHVGVAGRIIADDHNGKTGLDAILLLQNLRRRLDGLDHGPSHFLAINHSRHGASPDVRLFVVHCSFH